jgi:hypothetical protein
MLFEVANIADTDSDEESDGPNSQVKFGKLVEYQTKGSRNMTESRLAISGAPTELCSQLASSEVTFDRALEKLLEQDPSWESEINIEEQSTISDVMIAVAPAKPDYQFETVRTLNSDTGQVYAGSPCGPDLCICKHPDSKVVGRIEIDSDKPDLVEIGQCNSHTLKC